MDKTRYNTRKREYMAKRYTQRKAEAIAKLGGACVRCGATEDLQFDHIDPNTKKFVVSQKLATGAKKMIEEELEKCQLLCQGCHEKKTCVDLNRTYAKETHGTVSSYRYCKCDLCKAAQAARMKEYRCKKKI